ncbi:MAG: GGDEF domain-containing protein [Pseudomonadota bacterium]
MSISEETVAVRSEREFLSDAIRRGIVIVLLAIAAAVGLTALSVSDLPEAIQMRAVLTAIILPLLIAPPAIGYSIRQDYRTHKLMLEVHRLAHTDVMTGLSNRRAFMVDASEKLIQHNFKRAGLAVLLIDLDHFKRVNDQHGHEAGDFALKHVASRMVADLPPDAKAARLGGEEFAVLVAYEDLAGLSDLAEEMRNRVAQSPCVVGGKSIIVTISIGVGLGEGDDTISAMLTRADVALYEAKAQGRNRFAIAA